jgi:hypothetical protein
MAINLFLSELQSKKLKAAGNLLNVSSIGLDKSFIMAKYIYSLSDNNHASK